ncbi:hypothetical protein CBP31_01690 [Oceanisphaera profunda]|uniref:Uncharacterized protein n=1 Tax=Oceanisphaera profunda TaxID=1416627 RepID=A0A1Y0D1W8_9GAMM|nr:hypothetical protein CBP31_01690 [Oceanisphaera profunda]
MKPNIKPPARELAFLVLARISQIKMRQIKLTRKHLPLLSRKPSQLSQKMAYLSAAGRALLPKSN